MRIESSGTSIVDSTAVSSSLSSTLSHEEHQGQQHAFAQTVHTVTIDTVAISKDAQNSAQNQKYARDTQQRAGTTGYGTSANNQHYSSTHTATTAYSNASFGALRAVNDAASAPHAQMQKALSAYKTQHAQGVPTRQLAPWGTGIAMRV